MSSTVGVLTQSPTWLPTWFGRVPHLTSSRAVRIAYTPPEVQGSGFADDRTRGETLLEWRGLQETTRPPERLWLIWDTHGGTGYMRGVDQNAKIYTGKMLTGR